MNEAWKSTARLLDTPNGRLYAEWSLLLTDLKECLKIAELWKSISQARESESDLVVAASLFRDAVVRFMACFDKGMPVRLDANKLYAPPHTEGGEEFVRWLSSLRDTWIAHRHGVSRQSHATVTVDEATGELIGVGVLIMSLVSYDYEKASGFIRLIQMAISHAEKRERELLEKISNEVKTMYPAQLLRLPIAKAKVPDSQTLRLGRVKYSRVNRGDRQRE